VISCQNTLFGGWWRLGCIAISQLWLHKLLPHRPLQNHQKKSKKDPDEIKFWFNLHSILLSRTPPSGYKIFQMAAVSVVPAILDYLCDDVIRTELLPRARNVYSTNGADVKIVLSLLACIAKVFLDFEQYSLIFAVSISIWVVTNFILIFCHQSPYRYISFLILYDLTCVLIHLLSLHNL